MGARRVRALALSVAIVVLGAAFILAALPRVASAGVGIWVNQFPAETPDRPDMHMRIDGSRVVWEGASTTEDGIDVWYWDMTSATPPVNITKLAGRPMGDQTHPDISGDRIVYIEDVPADFQTRLRVFDLRTKVDFDLAPHFYYETAPDIDGNRIAFVGNLGGQQDIYLYTFASATATTASLTQITNSETISDFEPSLDGDRIAWSPRLTGDSASIRVYSISAGQVIYDSADDALDGMNVSPDIDGNRLVFLHAATVSGPWLPWYVNLGRPVPPASLTAEDLNCTAVRVSGDMAYWIVGSNPSGVVRKYSFSLGGPVLSPFPTSMPISASPAASIDVDGCRAVWDDGRAARRDLWWTTTVLNPKRLAGDGRAGTAVTIARESYGTTPNHWSPALTHVVIASGADAAAADPLSAAGLCWAYDAPLFLTAKTAIPASTLAALNQIHADKPGVKIIVVGGPGSVPDAQLTKLKSIFGSGNVERLLSTGGRYEMAAAVSARMRLVRGADMRDGVLFANGADPTKFFDALALSALSRANGMPILLVSRYAIPSATSAELTKLKNQATGHGNTLIRILGGGPGTVSESVRVGLGVSPGGRWYGPDRYSTAAVIAANATNAMFANTGRVAVAAKIPDALTGGIMAGQKGGVLLVTASGSVPAATGNLLHEHRNGMTECYLLGGVVSITPATATQITRRLAP